jgi:predicted transcriptional regulator
MHTVSAKLPEDLDRRLTEIARQRRMTRSTVMRLALEAFIACEADGSLTVGMLAADLIGCITDAPPELATNPKYMADFGK